MTDKRPDDLELVNDPDLELITDYLARELDQARVDEVRRRLDEDPAFRELAAPLIAIWNVPPRWQRKPMPHAELEKHWDDFTKRAGFVHQRRKARRRKLWLLAIVVAVVGLSGFLLRNKVRAAVADYRDYEQVSYDTGWIRLKDGTHVLLSPGSRLRALKKPIEWGMLVKLEGSPGSARFRAEPPDTLGGSMPELQPLAVQTANANVMTQRAYFSVTVRGDTTEVEVHRPLKRTFLGGFMPLPTEVALDGWGPNALTVNETERARAVRGSKPVKLTPTPVKP